MNKDLELKLVQKYPIILQDYGGNKRHTCMHWGMECGDGWYDLLDTLLQKLDYISNHSGVQVIANQIKEKFGTLRFYYSTVVKTDLNTDPIVEKIIEDVVSNAERRSAYICENTGKGGYLCSRGVGGWLKTLCKEEADKEQYIPTDKGVAKYWDEINNEIHRSNTEQQHS
jgi:hypothetical protein